MGEWSDPFNIVGFVGGVVLAASLLPQIYLAHSRKSTADISYLWQGVYTIGLLTLMVYYAHFSLWAVFYPMAFEFCCLMYLTGLKIYYEVFAPKAPPSPETVVSEFDMSRSGRIGRMPSKLALEALSDASKSGRVGRMLSDASKSGRMGRMMSDSGRSGIMARTMASPSTSVAGDDSREGGVGRPPVVGKPAVVRLFGGEIDSKDGLSGIAERRAGCDEGPAPAVSNDDRV